MFLPAGRICGSVRPKQDFSCFGRNGISAKLEMPIYGRNRYSADTTYFGRKKLISAEIMCFGQNILFRPEPNTVSADITADMYRQKHGYFGRNRDISAEIKSFGRYISFRPKHRYKEIEPIQFRPKRICIGYRSYTAKGYTKQNLIPSTFIT